MKCTECHKHGQTSCVFSLGSSSTLLGGQVEFWDVDGNRHIHDPSVVTTDYRCSNGHVWTEKRGGSCWCGWPTPIPSLEGGV